MEIVIAPRRRPRRSRPLRSILLLFGLLFLCVLVALGIYYAYSRWIPNGKHVPPGFSGVDKPIFYQGTMFDKPAVGTGNTLKLPLEVVQHVIDPSIVYEKATESIILTTKDKVLRLKTDQLTAKLNDRPFTLHVPAEETGGTVYVPVGVLKDLYAFDVQEVEGTGAVFLRRDGDITTWEVVPNNPRHPEATVAMRQGGSIREPILADLPQKTQVMLLSEQNGWYHVQLSNGYTGYVRKQDLVFDHTEAAAPKMSSGSDFVPWKPIGDRIVLTWEQVIQKNPDTSNITPMAGLNVISPTWFSLSKDKQGNIFVANHADLSYVSWAHKTGYQVWALFSNGFDPDLTSEALANYDRRMTWIRQLIAFAQMYHLQGINLDFENVYPRDKNNLTQFVREMTPLLHEQGLTVSIDVTVRGGSAMWSLFYDREALGRIVDYMMVMTYDEHWASSPVAGSVASLSWTEKGIADIISEDHVPPHKILLGIPYYTRIWAETTKDGEANVTSKTASMEAAEQWLHEKKVTPQYDAATGQNYAEYQENGVTYKVWLEDETSLKARAELVKKYDLAGIAAWRRGFEVPSAWNALQETLQKRQ